VVPEGQRPHPRRSCGRRGRIEDATDHDPIGQYIVKRRRADLVDFRLALKAKGIIREYADRWTVAA
jgi:hypothetical protein